MNKDYILFHLKEAQDALAQMINQIESDEEYEYGNFWPDMQHLYHHINTAWNVREADLDRAAKCSEEDFDYWRKFPSDLEMNI